jgi:hypothetical protein
MNARDRRRLVEVPATAAWPVITCRQVANVFAAVAPAPGFRLINALVAGTPYVQNLPRTRYRGVGADVIKTEEQMLLAQQCIANLRKILLEARKVHSQQDYLRLAEPILLEVQQREQEIFEYLSSDLEKQIAS